MGVMTSNQGIYKITSPKGRVYIGQTVDFYARFNKYRLLHCKGQRRLFNSFKKYGVENHFFEVVELCCVELMNERERYWQEEYDVLSKLGLNCKLQSTRYKKYVHSEETKRLISESNKGKKYTDKWKREQSQRKLNMSDETKQKISNANKGKIVSDSTREKIRKRMIGNSYTKGMTPVNARKVINVLTGEIYESVTIAAKAFGYKPRTLTAWLDGQNKNKSSLKFL